MNYSIMRRCSSTKKESRALLEAPETKPSENDNVQPSNEVFDLSRVKMEFAKTLAIEGVSEVVDVLLAAAMEQFIPGDPLWLMCIAPSGALKTELLRSLTGLEHAFLLSNLTSRTIISGYESKTEKKIVRGIHGKIDKHLVVMPELSEVLTKNHEERSQIFSQLRDLYDGHVVYGYGTTDQIIDVHCRIGLIVGMTGAIDLYTAHQGVLGERFLKIRPKWDREKALTAAMEQEDMSLERIGMAYAVKEFSTSLQSAFKVSDKIYRDPPELTIEQKTRIGNYAKLVGYLRVTVSSRAFRDLDTTEWLPEVEFPTRLAKQLLKLTRLLAIIRGKSEITEAEMQTVRRVAYDTCSTLRLKIVQTLYNSEDRRF